MGTRRKGQVLLLMVLGMGVGGLALGALLTFTDVHLRLVRKAQDQTFAYQAAAAAVEAVIADLRTGTDALAGGYTPPQVTLNGLTPTVTVAAPSVTTPPVMAYRYLDPGASAGLLSLAGGATWQVTLNGVEPRSLLAVSWTFTPSSGSWRVRLLDSQGQQVASRSGSGSPGWLTVEATEGTTYTLEFRNQGSGAQASQSFSSNGGRDSTWAYMRLKGQEYLVTAAVSGLTVRAYLRQLPGPGATSPPLLQAVVVESWVVQR
ncbi:MAG: hypothetical protein HY683_09015 [Chloroflexi bacterium]|nr:hypothetical protein [Chloroflexota bacterium]